MLDKTSHGRSEALGLYPHADVSAVAERRINDGLIDPIGPAWVGNFGLVRQGGEPVASGTLACADTDQSVHAASTEMLSANGMVVLNGSNTLVVAETYRRCLTAFDILATGDLVNRGVLAQLHEGDVSDGICIDAEEVIWVASPTTGSV